MKQAEAAAGSGEFSAWYKIPELKTGELVSPDAAIVKTQNTLASKHASL